LLIPVGNLACSKIDYYALINGHCVYEINGFMDNVLHTNRRIGDAILWEDENYEFKSFWNWSDEQKDDLRRAFACVERGQSLAVIDPPPNMLSLEDDSTPLTVIAKEHAWPLFLSHVANSLYLEAKSILDWSIMNYSDEELEVLLSSKYFFEWCDDGGYSLQRTRVGIAAAGWPLSRGNSLLSPPNKVYDFVVSNDMIRPTRVESIVRLLEWCQINLIHFTGSLTAQNVENQWQYRGLPPVSRIIQGTPKTTDIMPEIRHRTAGCHGTNGFLKDVLRVINIPVLYQRPENTGHATPYFLSEGKYLSHGDDPYNRYGREVPADQLLINQAQYDAWFGDPDNAPNNIGRQVYELALIYLPVSLLKVHCEDLEAGRSHSESHIFNVFDRWYTVAELEALQLWERIDQKIAVLGGCDNLP
jgi:hypothetical protein